MKIRFIHTWIVKQVTYIIFIFLLSFCKKDIGLNENSNTVVYKYSTNLNIQARYTITNSLPVFNSRVSAAYFYKQNSSDHWNQPVIVDSVILNNRLLKVYNNIFSQYNNTLVDTFLFPSYPPFTWKVKGNSEFPSFSETILDSLPQFTKSNMTPDSISKSGNTLLILGCTNADSLNLLISDGIHAGQFWGYVNVPSNTTSVTVSNAQILSTTPSGTLSIEYYKSFYKMVGDKKINFRIFSTYNKIIKIVE